MLSYMLPREEKDHQAAGYRPLSNGMNTRYSIPSDSSQKQQQQLQQQHQQKQKVTRTRSAGMFNRLEDEYGSYCGPPRPGSAAPLLPQEQKEQSDEHNHQHHRQQQQQQQQQSKQKSKSRPNGYPVKQKAPPPPPQRKSTLQSTCSKLAKDDSLHSIESDASTTGSERKATITKPINAPKHANLKRVSFGSSKGSMVETLVYETPVQEEPEINHLLEQNNGRLSTVPMLPVPDTDEGREKVRVSLLGPKPFPSTPGVLLLEPIGPSLDIMAASHAELLTAHTDHTVPTYHTQISTDSGWDNPFRPDGDLSREADEIVQLIKGGKPITPTPGQNAPALPGCDTANNNELNAQPRNGNAHSTPIKPQQPVNEKTATVEVSRVTAQGPGDASQVEHVTLKKKPKCKCCVLQ